MKDKNGVLKRLEKDISVSPDRAKFIVVHDNPGMHSPDVYVHSEKNAVHYFNVCKTYGVENLYLLTIHGEILRQHEVME